MSECRVGVNQSKQLSSKPRSRTAARDNVLLEHLRSLCAHMVLIHVCCFEHFPLQLLPRALWFVLDFNDDDIASIGVSISVSHATDLAAPQVIFDIARKFLECTYTSTAKIAILNHRNYKFGVSICGTSVWFEIPHPIPHLLGITTIIYSYDSVVTHLSGVNPSVKVTSNGVVRVQCPGTLTFFAIICCHDSNFNIGVAPIARTRTGTPIACDVYAMKLE